MVLVIVFKSSFLLFSMLTGVKEYVCMAIVSLVSLSSSSAMRMAVISAFSPDTESLSLMIISSSLCTYIFKRPRLRARRVKVRFSLRAIILSLENLNVIIRAIN